MKPEQIQNVDLFLEIAMFLGQKLTKLGQIQVVNFFFHYSTKCRFDHVSFDQLSFTGCLTVRKIPNMSGISVKKLKCPEFWHPVNYFSKIGHETSMFHPRPIAIKDLFLENTMILGRK